ncbi:MAG: hypothetical protein ABL959_22535, partial [Pyrinomonadaceae bacterium]
MFEFPRSPVRFAVQLWSALVVLCAFSSIALAQTPTATPTPTVPSTDPLPSQPSFVKPVRPMPSGERVGINAADQLSLSLEQAIEMALKNNNDIDASRNTVQI